MTLLSRKFVSAKKGKSAGFEAILKSTAGFLAVLFIFTPTLQAVAAENSRETQAADIVPERSADTNVLLETPTFKQDVLSVLEREFTEVKPEKNKEDVPEMPQEKPEVRPDTIKIDTDKPTTIEKPGPEVMSLMGGGGPIVPEPQIRTGAPYSDGLRAQSDVDRKSGAMGYTYPLDLPPGRNGLTPQLALTYSSNIHNLDQTLFGNGWGISVPRIERMTRQGVDNVFANRFQSSVSGDLSFIGGTEYGARIEQGDFTKYTFSGNVWTGETKTGMVYTYGATTTERMASSSGDIYAWYISKIQDANGNYISFQYYKDQGQLYPDTITYTHAPGVSGIFSVTFVRGARPTPATSYRTGYLVTTAYRVTSIEVRAQSVLRKKYDLSYSTGDNTLTPLLHGITETSYTAAGASLALPMTTFDYATHSSMWTKNTDGAKWVYPTLSNDNQSGIGVEYADVNGDGLTDIVTSRFHWEDYAWNGTAYVPNVPNPVPYEYHTFINNGSTWVENSVWNLPVPFRDEMNRDYGTRLTDINGDGLIDVVCFGPNKWAGDTRPGSYPLWQYVFRNTGSGWTWDQALSVPTALVKSDHSSTGARIVDVNGDGLPDVLISDSTNAYGVPQNNYAYMNLDGGVNWLTGQTTWAYPAPVQPWFSPNQSVWMTTPSIFFADLNGDGLQDILWEGVYNNSYNAVTGRYHRAYLNNGSGWTRDDNYASPLMLTMAGYYYDPGTGQQPVSHGSGIVDINGDGLVDIIQTEITTSGSGSSMTTSTVDTVLLNKGNGWSSATVNLPIHLVKPVGLLVGSPPHADMTFDEGVRVSEFNGDGIGDIIKQANVALSLPGEMYLGSSTGTADLLNRITIPTGATTDVEYKPAGWYVAGTSTLLNAGMPSAQLQTVSRITIKDATTTVGQTDYQYEGGKNHYNSALPWDRVFSGFGKVTLTSASSVRMSYFHQGDVSNSSQGEYLDTFSKIGMPYREEVRDLAGRLYSATVTKWESSTSSVAGSEIRARYRVSSPQAIEMSYTATSSHRDSAIGDQFDTAGNITQHTQYGEVTGSDDGTFTDTGTDQRVTVYDYATFATTTRISSYPYQVTESGATGTSRFTAYIYDNTTTGTVQGGSVTKQVQGNTAGTIAAVTRWTYDATGLPLTKIDPRGATTTYSYDAPKLYVSTTTNALAQTTVATWDYANGSPTRIQDVNGAVRRAVYDPFGRLADQYGPSTDGTETLLTHMEYVDTPGSLLVTRVETVDATNTSTFKTYFDALGREVQSRRSWPENTVTKDTAYGIDGQVAWVSLPYASTGLSRTAPTAVAAMRTKFIYDPLGRVTTTTDALGSTLHAYSAWTTIQTDRMGRQKTFERDAFGQLVKVTERLAGTPYDTAYVYDWSGALTKITDAQGNLRSMSYDVFGNRTSIEDLHSATDTTFGIEASTYDLNGNLATSTRADGTVVSYSYDALNRLLKSEVGITTIDQYVYDTCVNGKGKTCKEFNSSYSRSFDYDSAGNTASTTFSFGGTSYTTKQRYALNGALAGYTSPEGHTVTYRFIDDKPIYVYTKELAGNTTTLAVLVRYHPSGVLWQISDGSGVYTASYFDDAHLYRMYRKRATIGATHIQDLNYSYDAMGNITALSDVASSTVARNVTYAYDDLDRLVAATGTSPTSALLYAENYSYDILGNILQKKSTQATSTVLSTYAYTGNTGSSYANPHAVTSIINQQGTSTLSTLSVAYDQKGNPATSTLRDAASAIIPGTERTYTWDSEDALARLVVGTGTSSRDLNYLYGVGGDRIQQREASSTSLLHVSKNYNLTMSATGTVMEIRKPIFSGNLLLATIQGSGVTAKGYWNHADHLSSAGITVDASSVVHETVDYLPFGSIRFDQKFGSWSEQRKYAGHQFDDNSGLSFMEARYYDPATGRFLNEDPAFRTLSFKLEDPQSLNSYAYARNNPLKYVDLDGKAYEQFHAWPFVGGPLQMLDGLGKQTSALYINLTQRNDPTWSQIANRQSAEGVRDSSDGALSTALDASFVYAFMGSSKTESANASQAKLENEARVTSKNVSSIQTKGNTNTVYQGVNEAGKVKYVGITSRDPKVRFAEHQGAVGSGREALRYDVVSGATNLSRSGARSIEQTLINQYGLEKNGGALLNKVNSVAPKYWSEYGIK